MGPAGVDPTFVRIIFREATLAKVFAEAAKWADEYAGEDGGLRNELVLYTTEVAALGDPEGWELALYVSDDAGVFGGADNSGMQIEVN